jgi:hypothetical protein
MIASYKERNTKQDGHNNNGMLVNKLLDHISHRINNNRTYQLGVDFIETNQSFFRPLYLSRISALAHALLELGNDKIHLFRFTSASGREGTKGRLGTDTAQARGAVDTSELTIRAFGDVISAEITVENTGEDTAEVSLSALIHYSLLRARARKISSYLLIRLCNLLMT